MPTMLILGASSDIARAAALAFGKAGWNVHLAGRNAQRLEKLAADLGVRTGTPVEFSLFDAMRPEAHTALWQELSGKIHGVLCVVGLLGDQEKARHDMALADAILRTNFSGLVPIVSMAADTFEERGEGLIIGVGSVAGDRGRASNYVYGSAKAGFTAFLSGLRNRLARRGVQVLTVKPGFVRTAMTEGMRLPEALTASPEQVADAIVRATQKKRDVIYCRWFWRWIMAILKAVPEAIFKRISL